MADSRPSQIAAPLQLTGGVVLKNRIIKSAMSDSLADGRGNPTEMQIRLYERWARGGASALIVGEVQGSSLFAERPGNLVLAANSETEKFQCLAERGSVNNTRLWLQLGHAGAMAYPPISTPRGPSALDLPGLSCAALSHSEINKLPAQFAATALLAQELGFNGVQIHAAHGFLLSQFLSPLFNHRKDEYGGAIQARMKLLIDVIDTVRRVVDEQFVVAVKLNATDQLEGGLQTSESLDVIAALENRGVDLIDISGGTYFPGARSASDTVSTGPYFTDYARMARQRTSIPLLVTGGFKKLSEAHAALNTGCVDVIGLARALVLNPDLPDSWLGDAPKDPQFPSFSAPPEGGITAWYTMRLTSIAEGSEEAVPLHLDQAVERYEQRDRERVLLWNRHFRENSV